VGFQFVASLCASFLSPLAGYSYDTLGFADTYMILAAIVILMTIISSVLLQSEDASTVNRMTTSKKTVEL
jgi:OHS family lactose permease-like MFS transporter